VLYVLTQALGTATFLRSSLNSILIYIFLLKPCYSRSLRPSCVSFHNKIPNQSLHLTNSPYMSL
jgi:hypothetical protein